MKAKFLNHLFLSYLNEKGYLVNSIYNGNGGLVAILDTKNKPVNEEDFDRVLVKRGLKCYITGAELSRAEGFMSEERIMSLRKS